MASHRHWRNTCFIELLSGYDHHPCALMNQSQGWVMWGSENGGRLLFPLGFSNWWDRSPDESLIQCERNA